MIDKARINKTTTPPFGVSKKRENPKKIRKEINLSRNIVTNIYRIKPMRLFYHPLLFILFYLCIHLSIRLIFDNSIQVDDREQILHAQEILLGYDMPQPPLYSWLVYYSFKLFGVNLYALSILKYSLIFITFVFVHKISNLIIGNTKASSLLTFSFLLMASFAWHMHQGFTHTIMLSLGIVMSTYFILKIANGGSLWEFLMLGISFSIGILGKYSFLLYMLLMVLTLLSNKELRKKFIEKRTSITILSFVFFTLPHFLWLLDNWNRIYSQASIRLGIENNSLSFIEVLSKLIIGSVGFLSPLIFILVLINFDKFLIKAKSIKNISLNEVLFRNFFLYLTFLLIIFALFFDIKEVRVRWLHPILMIAPFWFFLIIERYGGLSIKRIRIYSSAVIIFTILVIAIRLIQNTIGPQLGHYGRLNVPIIETLKSIPRDNLDEISRIKTPDFNLGSHLFTVFRNKTIIIGNKTYGSKNLVASKKCLILFDNDGSADVDRHKMETKYGKFLELESRSEDTYKIYYQYLEGKKC